MLFCDKTFTQSEEGVFYLVSNNAGSWVGMPNHMLPKELDRNSTYGNTFLGNLKKYQTAIVKIR